MDQSNQYLKGAFILTSAALIVKILSAVYRVPFQNIVGDIGFYIYQQVYPIYGIALILATSGFPVIISKLAAESESDDRKHLAHTMQAAFLTLLIVGIFLFCLFFFGSDIIAGFMGDQLLAPLVRISSYMFLFLPFFSLGRGYFQSVGVMVPTAISQVTEQSVRVIIIILTAFLLVKNGESLYKVGTGAITGSLIGGVCGILVLLFFAMKRTVLPFLFVKGLSVKKFYRTAQIVLIHGMIISLSGMILILFQMIDSFSIYSILVKSGYAVEEAKAIKGVFDRGQPLLQLGTVAASSFSLALVPLIATAWRNNDKETINRKAESAIKITTVIGLGATVGLVNIMRPTNSMLFSTVDGSAVLSVLVVTIFFSSLILVCSGVLQGFGQVGTLAKYIVVGLFVKAVGNFILIPILATMGAAISTLIGVLVMAILFLANLNRRIHVLRTLTAIWKPLFLASILMTVTLQLWMLLLSNFEPSRLLNTFIALSSVMIGAAIYLGIIMKFAVLSEEELALIPFGDKFYKSRK
ncbi:putative polysaccharide biosynthesis protein [Bacillus niameyensis]|uniref:putative polysaccharide biosynthesis protein n=1 Tax=Bacillus niameyensis TaxID=1522308 RepID=UPI00078374D9|nr:polysaccharide biosynthesis protein [Bacillus niameyensis]